MMRLLLALAVSPLIGHDLYLMPGRFSLKVGESLSVAFHNGDNFPDTERAANPANILEPQIVSRAGKSPLRDLRVDGTVLRADAVVADAGTALVTARSRPNVIELEAVKFEEYLRHEGLDHVIRWRAEQSQSSAVGRERYSKYVKSIVIAGAPDDFYRTPIGFPIELLADRNPALLKPGEVMTVTAVVRGKPAPDLQVEMAWLPPGQAAQRKVAGRTGRDGKLTIPIASPGVWKLHAVMMERCQEQAVADWESFWTSLTFEVR